jgi:hypothetical protein
MVRHMPVTAAVGCAAPAEAPADEQDTLSSGASTMVITRMIEAMAGLRLADMSVNGSVQSV